MLSIREVLSIRPIIGGIEAIEEVIDQIGKKGMRPQKLIVTDPHLSGKNVKQLWKIAAKHGLSFAKLPKLNELENFQHESSVVKPIALEDLLGRPQVVLDDSAIAELIRGKYILVTGAGGTIGSELCMQVARYKPTMLVMLDNSEYNLYIIDQEIKTLYPMQQIRSILADVRLPESFEFLFSEYKFDLVFHAAALKHVPILEDNIYQAVLTNVLGTKHVADICNRYGVKEMVLISTDKAVKPISVMGVTKRLAENYCQAMGQKDDGVTIYSTVRFGNVLGSSGSVIPLFQKQIARGGPVTVTDPAVERYFMTVQEAVGLILQAASIQVERETHSAIYVLDMGEPINIDDLARQAIRLAGYEPGRDIKIEYIGLRPGEKLNEELFALPEAPISTEKSGVLLAASRKLSYNEVNQCVSELKEAVQLNQQSRVVEILTSFMVLPSGD
ncbi:MAG: polysaccharide biosynthesis protein [Alphaproteobacteria bacterium]|nr:polysaccharide biosynthesis protein [Alphaproteobacteria bacterium]